MRRRAWTAGLSLACLAVSACKVPDAQAYNLRALHTEDGRHRSRAGLISGTEYLVRLELSRLRNSGHGQVGAKDPVTIEDPLSVCVDTLLALADFPVLDERVAALKIECFARIARLDPWQISRQICMEQLGAAGERLGMAQRGEEAEAAGEVATPDRLREALAPLLVLAGPDAAEPPPEEFSKACRAIAALRYDAEGVLRALAASGGLHARVPASSPNRRAILELLQDLERRTVRMALERGLGDPSPHVRAAAAEACVRASGPAALAQLIPRLGAELEPEMPLAILAEVRRRGLPPRSPATGDEDVREEQLAMLYRTATEHPVDRVRCGAMRALGAVAGAGFRSLREWDWQGWWLGRPRAVEP